MVWIILYTTQKILQKTRKISSKIILVYTKPKLNKTNDNLGLWRVQKNGMEYSPSDNWPNSSNHEI